MTKKTTYRLTVHSDAYRAKVKAFADLDVCRYELACYQHQDDLTDVTVTYVLKTDSKSELKLRMAVYGFKLGDDWTTYDSEFGHFANIDVEKTAGE